jgi:CDP-glucose 4,6-dehydratase
VSGQNGYSGVPVLVTGAQGFIGSWLARRLLDGGAHVIVPARPTPGPDGCDVVDVDILDRDSLTRAIDEHSVRAVFHLGARSTVEAGHRDPLGTFDVNVRGTYTVLDACRTATDPVHRIVVSSSLAAGGASNPYDASKAAADAISRSYAQAYGLPVAVLRLANVYGGGDLNYTRLVPDTARALVCGERPVLRSDGTPRRDFLYVEDAVDAYLAVAASLDDPATHGRAWDAGAGDAVAVLDVVRRLIAAAGRDIEPVIDTSGSRPGAPDRRAVDASALRDELGWRPRWQLDDGLAETWRSYERQLR